MGKFTISMAIFNSKLLVYQRVINMFHIGKNDQPFSVAIVKLPESVCWEEPQ